MFLDALKNTFRSGLQKVTNIFWIPEDSHLPSLPEPYIPDPTSPVATTSPIPSTTVPVPSTSTMGQQPKLREIATKKLHGPDANPSQLGDPVSLKAEQSETIPKSEEAGAQSETGPGEGGRGYGGNSEGEKLMEKAAKKLHGEGANPSQLGDPISLKNETSESGPEERKRDSKL